MQWLLSWLIPAAFALSFVPSTIPPVPPTPCDLGGNISCASTWSVARQMKSSYSGNLFQLGRQSDGTTLNVGQTAQHIADLSGVWNFCKGTYCSYTKVYDQSGNGNDLVYLTSAMPSVNAACNFTDLRCAPPFMIDPATNAPIMRTTYPSAMALALDGNSTGINAGANAMSIYSYGTDHATTDCCGTSPGLSHAFSEPDVLGTYFGPWIDYGQRDNTFFQCATTTSQCAGNSWESADRDGADYTPTPLSVGIHDIAHMQTWDGSAATNTVKIYINSATPIYTKTPPCPVINTAPCLYGVNTINVGKHIHWGSGGDQSQIDKVVREAIVSNNVLAASDFTPLNNNTTGFYAAVAPTCAGSAAIALSWDYLGSNDHFQTPYMALLAYGLYQMRADYYGPIADLRDALGTVNTYSPASSGCVIDTAAATFCAANPPCTVAKLYNQGTWSSVSTKTHDTNTDMVQATVAKQPTVTFAALNGKPVMNFTGTEFLHTAAGLPSFPAEVFWLVGKRTANTSSYAQGLSSNTGSSFLGWKDAAGTAVIYNGSAITAGATDSHWHALVAEYDETGGSQGHLYADDVAGSVENTASTVGPQLCIGIACDGTTNPLTGSIAETGVAFNWAPGTTGKGYQSTHTRVFNAVQTPWGTLPN
jgi:hypothetical protein